MKQTKNNINKLKDEAFKQMLNCGKELEKQINKNTDLKELEEMNSALQKGIQQNLITYKLRNLLLEINKNDIDTKTAIKSNSEYKYWYYIEQLANLTENEELKVFVKMKKKEAL